MAQERKPQEINFKQMFGRFSEVVMAIFDAVLELGGTFEDLERFRKRLGQDQLLRQQLATLILERSVQPEPAPAIEFFTPLPDTAVPEAHQATLAKYRALATKWGVATTTSVCYLVKSGFTLKRDAAQMLGAYKRFQHLQDWNFPDAQTEDSLVFWIPKLVPNSTSKTKDEQIKLLADLRHKLELPDHHLTGFGNVALLAGLVLAHYKATNERIPAHQQWARTDTRRAVGSRLLLGDFDAGGLDCDLWRWDGGRSDGLGVFALGVEKTLGS